MTPDFASNSPVPAQPEAPISSDRGPKYGALSLVMAALTAAIGIAVALKVPLWGRVAWGIHEPPNWGANLPLLAILAGLWVLHARWTRPGNAAVLSFGKLAALCGLSLSIGLSARLGELSGLARLSMVTVNSASGGFFEAAFDSQNDPNWLRNYPALMRKYHHVHSHPPGGVWVMRWWLSHRGPLLTTGADNFLAFSPGTNCQILAQYSNLIWKKTYSADDLGAAWWAGMTWLICASLVPAGVAVAANGLFGARAAWHSAALSCAVPSLILFVPAADSSYVFCTAWALALAVFGWNNAATMKGRLSLGAAGVVAALGVTGTFAGAWILALIGLFLALRRDEAGAKKPLAAAIFGGAAVVTLLGLQVLGVNWWLLWRSVIAFNVDPDVPPILRFVYHFADFFTFFGLAASVVLMWGILRAKRRSQREILLLAVPTLGLLLLLNIVISMAETARIWMLFLPMLLVAVGGVLGEEELSPRLRNWLLGWQIAQTWLFVVFLNVWSQ